MSKYSVNITATAFEDLKSIALHIKDELKEPLAAEKLIARIKGLVFSLDTFPHRHELVRDKILAKQGYRPLYVENHIVFYIVSDENKRVDILRVLYAKRDWMRLLVAESKGLDKI
jgi:Plasmid stabilization system protein